MGREYIGKPNEYYMLRRAARRLAERFVSCHDFWDCPGEIANLHASLLILKSCADKIESKVIKRLWCWDD
jgi:hypothetical protein